MAAAVMHGQGAHGVSPKLHATIGGVNPWEMRLFRSRSNQVEFLTHSAFPDFRGLVVAAFFVNPPAVGFFFPIGESEVVTAMDAYPKDGQDQCDGDCHRDEPSFGHGGARAGENFFKTQFPKIDFHMAQQLNGHSFKPGFRCPCTVSILGRLAVYLICAARPDRMFDGSGTISYDGADVFFLILRGASSSPIPYLGYLP